MSTIYYSIKTDAFYPKDMLKDYKTAGTLPDDLIQISNEDFVSFSLNTPPQNKVRGYINGVFVWKTVEVTEDVLINSELLWVNSELDNATKELEKVQDSDPKAFGSVSDWRVYRKELRSWEFDVNFPNKQFRPISPIFKE